MENRSRELPDAPIPARRSRLGRNTVILLVSNVGGAALSFAIAALIGRVLGERGLGVYAVAMAWIAPLSLLVEFGLGTLMTRDLASDPERAPTLLRRVIRFRLTLGVPLMLVVIAAASLIASDGEIAVGLVVSAPMVLIVPLVGAYTATFRARERMIPVAALNIGMLAAQTALTAAILAAGWGVVAALIINTVTSAGQLAAAWVLYRWSEGILTQRREETPRKNNDGKTIPIEDRAGYRTLIRRAFPFALAAVFAALHNRLTILMLESLTTTDQVGLFAAANRITEAARMFPNAFFGAIFPMLTALAADPARMAQVFRRAAWALTAFGVGTGLALTALGSLALTAIYGERFAAGAAGLALLGWALALSVLRGLWTIRAYADGRESHVNAVNAAVIALQMVLGLLLIPRFGVEGAAWTHIVVEAAAWAALIVWRRGGKPS
jgi:O-antigen/teichoic acid export membrane protein